MAFNILLLLASFKKARRHIRAGVSNLNQKVKCNQLDTSDSSLVNNREFRICFKKKNSATVVAFNILLLLASFKKTRRHIRAGISNLNQKEKCNRKQSQK